MSNHNLLETPSLKNPQLSNSSTSSEHQESSKAERVGYQSTPPVGAQNDKSTRRLMQTLLVGLTALLCIPLVYAYFQSAIIEPTFIRVPDLVRVKSLTPHHHPSHDSGNRLILIGDVHGRLDALKHLLKKLNHQPENDHIVLLGDMITKGADSVGVLDFVMALNSSCVRGNHEDSVLHAYANLHKLPPPKIKPPSKRPNPHSKSLPSDSPLNDAKHKKKKFSDSNVARILRPPHIEYIGSCPAIISLGPVGFHNTEAVAVHAGLQWNIDTLEAQDPEVVFTMRTLLPPNYVIPREDRKGKPWSQVWTNKQSDKSRNNDRMTVFYGHDAHGGLTIRKYSAGLDSGCVSGGKLTAMVISQDADGNPVHTVKSVSCF